MIKDKSFIDLQFELPDGSSKYSLVISLNNDIDSAPSIYSYVIRNRTMTGCRIEFTSNIDTDNYYIDWMLKLI